jgi:hypothetical protein
MIALLGVYLCSFKAYAVYWCLRRGFECERAILPQTVFHGVPCHIFSPSYDVHTQPNAPTSSPQAYLQPFAPNPPATVYLPLLPETGTNHRSLGVGG